MRSEADYRAILQLWERHIPKKRIGIMLGIPRATVRDCINRYGSVKQLDEAVKDKIGDSAVNRLMNAMASDDNDLLKSYAYLLGMYLGDGYIDQLPRTYRMRITLDARYPSIIDYCSLMFQILFTHNKITIQTTKVGERVSYVNVTMYSTQLADYFPQHGIGKKDKRSIYLQRWQDNIVKAQPLEFFRGLYHSDGSRFDNEVNGKAYPRYQFTNSSHDICALFTMTCERLGVHYTVKKRPARKGVIATDVFISRREDVAYLDASIGRKC